MDSVHINITQVLGTVFGLLVIITGVAVNVKNSGGDVPLSNIAVFIAIGILLSLGIFLLSRD